MADLDQGGTSRWTQALGFGPSVGATTMIAQGVMPILVAGTYFLDPSVDRVEVSCNGAVTIVLYSAFNPTAPAIAVPRPYFQKVVRILDVGGFAATFPIMINPTGSETIIGLPTFGIFSAFGTASLTPSNLMGGWDQL
jgi:hypothetical protein